MRYRNDVIRSVFLHHILVNLGMMLARDYTSCHTARSTLVMIIANNVQTLRLPAKNLDLNPIDKLLDQLKRKVRTVSTHPQGAIACYSSDVWGHSITVYSQTPFINE